MSEWLKNPEQGNIRVGVTVENLIRERGYTGSSLAPFADVLLTEWHTQIFPNVKQTLADFHPVVDTDSIRMLMTGVSIPTANVEVLGVLHSSGKTMKTPYARAVQEYVNTSIKSGYIWIAEEGLSEGFGIQDIVKELTDSDTYWDKLSFDPEISAFKNAVNEIKRQAKPTTFTSNKKLRSMTKRLLFIGHKFFRRAETGLVYQKIVDMAKLPEPLDMEIELILANGDEDRENMRIDRSIIQTREICQVISQSKSINAVQSIGIVCGLEHKSRIAYLLTHPEYDPHTSLASAKDLLLKNT